ncbi:hypothetical protein ppKF707_5654 [Metapseudomonas furukawaii]|nr:hypothetical protein ppKF707_5654 [Pseudomonas furukawaii]
MEAEAGGLAEEAVSRQVPRGGGEFHLVGEGFTEGFLAVEGQHVEGGIEPVDCERVPAVIEEGADFSEHVQASPGRNRTGSCWMS